MNKCNYCGKCNTVCPIIKITNMEIDGPRAKIIFDENNIRSSRFYRCTLCGACKAVCPKKIDIPDIVLKNREKIKGKI